MTETTDDLRARIVAAIRRAPFKELRTVDYANGPLQITANVDDLADAVLRAVPPAAVPSAPADQTALRDRIAETIAVADGWEWPSGLNLGSMSAHTVDHYQGLADAVLAVLPEPADRAAVLREAANGLAALGPLDSLVSAPAAWTEAIETVRRMADQIAEDELRRMADEAQQPSSTAPLAANLPLVKGRCPACNGASLFLGDGGYVTCSRIDCPEPDAAGTALEQPAVEAQQPTPCDQPNACDADTGELCATHEEEQAHADGEHEYCGVTCGVQFPSEEMRNFVVAKGYPGTAGMLDELLRRAATGQLPAADARQADTAGEQQ